MSMAGVLHGGGRPGGSGRPDRLALLFCLLHIAGSPSMARDSCKEQGGSPGRCNQQPGAVRRTSRNEPQNPEATS